MQISVKATYIRGSTSKGTFIFLNLVTYPSVAKWQGKHETNFYCVSLAVLPLWQTD